MEEIIPQGNVVALSVDSGEESSVLIVPLWSCYKCGEPFSDERSLQRHLTSKTIGSCIGVWYVCRRCLEFFDKPSVLRRHQGLKRGCAKAVLGGKTIHHTTTADSVPLEAMVAVRLKRGAEDAGGMMPYLQHVVNRGNHQEMRDVLQACSVSELDVLLGYVQTASDDTALFIDLLAQLSDFSNTEDVSPEKRAKLKDFVNRNVTL